MSRWLPFERPLQELEERIAEAERFTAARGLDKSAEIAALRERYEQVTHEIFANLSAWDQVLLARHPSRPYTLDYLQLAFDDFLELHGDRRFGDDPAVVAGLARLADRSVAVIGHQKGRDLKERQFRNFGSARPEGYRKAMRVMKLAEKRRLPVICLVDTPAAESRLEAEERGISESIAASMATMARLAAPVTVIIIGEGGSGGAIALCVGDRVMMLEHAIYSVIPPESCAVILEVFGRDAARGPEAAEALRLSSEQTLRLGAVDEVIPEPLGGAHRDPAAAARAIREAILRSLAELDQVPTEELAPRRYAKFRGLRHYVE